MKNPEALFKLKIELPCDPAIPVLGIYPEKTLIQRYMHSQIQLCYLQQPRHGDKLSTPQQMNV